MIGGILPDGPAGRELLLVVATASLASVTLSLGMPLLSIVLDRHGVDPVAIGFNTALGGVGSLAAAPFAEAIARRVGAVRTMQGALALAAGTLLLFPLAVDLRLWSLWRMLLGAAGATLFIVSEAAINALAPPDRRGRILGLYATAFSLGFAAGPLLLAITGSEGWPPFLVAAGFLLAAALPLRLVAGIDRLLAAQPSAGANTTVAALLARAGLPLLGVLIYGLLETSFFALLPVYVLALGRPEQLAALLLSVWIAGNILLQLPIGRLADRIGPDRALLLCGAASTLALLALDPAIGAGWPAWPLLLVGGGTMGAFYTLSLVLVGARFATSELVRANAAFVASFQLGLLLGPSAVGAAMGALGPETFAWPLALATAFLVVALVRPVARSAGCSP
ncbi:MAG: MFS transporter [Geminicoccaceae bacterium]|nr:MAG: MFS transporter [Geminicoccaceae bacterium]